MKVRFVAFVRVRKKRELGDAEHISVDILDTLLPHRTSRGVVEHANLEAERQRFGVSVIYVFGG